MASLSRPLAAPAVDAGCEHALGGRRLAARLFTGIYRHSVGTGLLARYSAESVS